ncbi:MAG: beta-propeller fold lactonase family protein [Acidiferrobacter sp.]
MPLRPRIVGILLACVVLTGCQGSGSASAGASGAGALAAPTGTGLQQCQPVTPTTAASLTPVTPTSPLGGTIATTLVLAVTGNQSLGVYLRNPWTGALVDRGYVPTGRGPDAVASDQGQYVYVANATDGTISAYQWSPAQAELRPLNPGATNTIASGPQPVALTVDAGYLYVANAGNGTISVFAIGTGGALTLVGTDPAANLTALVAAPGRVYGLNNSTVISYAITTDGTLRPVSTMALVGGVDATTDSAGNLYVVTATAVTGYASIGGTLTAVESVPLPAGLTPAAITVGGAYAEVVGSNGGGTELAYFAIGGGHVGCATTALLAAGTASAVSASPQGHSVTVASRSRNDLLAYSVPRASAAPVLSGIVRTRLRPLALMTVTTTITNTPQMLYVVDQGTNSMAAYPVQEDGALGSATVQSTCSTCSGPATGPSAAAVNANGTTLYASDWASASAGDVTFFPIQNNGGLGAPTAVAAGNAPMGIAVDPSNRYLYVVNSDYINATTTTAGAAGANPDIEGYVISASGLVAMAQPFVLPAGVYPMLLTVDPTGRFVYVAEEANAAIAAFSLEADSGALTAIGTSAAGANPWAVVVGPSGRTLYATDNNTSGALSIFTIDSASGLLTPVATLNVSDDPLGLAIGPKGRRLYVATQGSTAGGGTVQVFERQQPLAQSSLWSATPVVTLSGFTNPYGLAVGTSGKALYVVSNCFSSTGGSVTALTIPSFADGGSVSAYAMLSTAATGTCSVAAIAAGGLG